MRLGKYSFGVGDRFAHQGKAQLRALIEGGKRLGVEFTPVWNKSNREHTIVHSQPSDTRTEADAAVAALAYKGNYFVDADHINMSNVDAFIASSDFFTIDVADYIGSGATDEDGMGFINSIEGPYYPYLRVPGVAKPFDVSQEFLWGFSRKFLHAAREAGRIYRHIRDIKGEGAFITEVSMDEVDEPQTPIELFFILHALHTEGVPVQTIAPKFTGRFNKGVDYVGDVKKFAEEFEQDLLVIDYAVRELGLPEELKLSIHSGSDKFSIYPIMGSLLKKYDKGIHVKTAGTTWLEELIGLAEGEQPEAVALVKEIYSKAFTRSEELCAPYATVIDIKTSELPSPSVVEGWTGKQFASALRHIENNADYNPNLRQLLHVAYKVAAECGARYTAALVANEPIIAQQVFDNLVERHLAILIKN